MVPPNQAETMVEALRAKGVPVAYLAFEGESHGFRQAANIKRSLEAELYFFGRILGYTPQTRSSQWRSTTCRGNACFQHSRGRLCAETAPRGVFRQGY